VPDKPSTQPPATAKHPVVRTHHGHSFTDDYEWLREKDSPEVRDHLAEENTWTEQQLAHLAPLRESLFEEIRSRTQETDLSVPSRLGAWWYYARTIEGRQYPLQARCPVAADDDWTPPTLSADVPVPGEQVLLDLNELAEGHEFFSLGSLDVSDDGTLLAYSVDVEGDERYTVRLRDLVSGTDLPDEIPDVGRGAVLAPSGRHVFCTTLDDAWRPDAVVRHEVGRPTAEDTVVLREDDERFWLGMGLTRSRRFLQIEAGSKITSEVWLLDLHDPAAEPRTVWPRREGVEYSVEHLVVTDGGGTGEERPAARDLLVVCHNAGAQNFELALTGLPGPEPLDPADAVVVLPHDPAVRIEDVDAFAGHVAVSYRRDALARVGIVRLDAASVEAPWSLDEIAFDEQLGTVELGANPEFAQPTLRLGHTSFVTPAQVLDHDVATGTTTLLKQQVVRGGYDPSDYEQRRVWATAEDGVRVPVSLVWRRDAVPGQATSVGERIETPAPMVLYGYGSYETSIDPSFSVPRLSLLDRGVVFAVAHVRGGGELGRSWYEAGRLTSKRTTFTDFVACARHLVDTGWTAPDRLVAEGASAGGLLVGAVANLAPELFAGVLAGVPFVDALTSILDPTLPLTVVEWDEWGDPLHDPEVYEYMRGYSPYENVREGVAYPRVLATTSLNDTRVLYVEPAKWVARLREAGAPALLKIEMEAGHGGVSGRYARWHEIAFEDAWVLDVLGRA